MKRAHLVITGLVQGVNFRFRACQEAVVLGVTGWVKNLPNGAVEAVIEGQDLAVDQMIDWCHKGPRSANVRDVQVDWEDFEGKFKEFRTRP